MRLTDFSSIFELLCGYNFVNAVNEKKDALKFLDFTTPMRQVIEETKEVLNSELRYLLDNNGHENRVQAVSEIAVYRLEADKLDKKILAHDVQMSNLYLLGGIFCMFILVYSGLLSDFVKLNSFPLLFFGTLCLYGIFLVCDHFKRQNHLKGLIVAFIGLLVALLILQQFKILMLQYNRTDNFYWILIISLSLLLLMVVLRKNIIKRKSYKAFFIFLFMLGFFVPDTNIMFSEFYTQNLDHNNNMIGTFVNVDVLPGHVDLIVIPGRPVLFLVVITIIIAGLPFIYDLCRNSYFKSALTELAGKINVPYVQKGLKKEGVALTDKELDPVNI